MSAAAESLIFTDGGHATNEPHGGPSYHGNTREAQVVARWHDEVHPGSFRFCDQQPCHAIRQVDA
jgi:hypothetical protein